MGRRGLRVAAGPAKRGKGGRACPCRRSDPTAPPANAKSRGGLSLRSFDSSRTEMARFARVVFRYAHVDLRCAGRGASVENFTVLVPASLWLSKLPPLPARGRARLRGLPVASTIAPGLGRARGLPVARQTREDLQRQDRVGSRARCYFPLRAGYDWRTPPDGLCRGALWCPPDYDPTGPPAQELIRSVRRMSQPMLPRPRTTGCYVQSRKGRLPPAQHRRRDRT